MMEPSMHNGFTLAVACSAAALSATATVAAAEEQALAEPPRVIALRTVVQGSLPTEYVRRVLRQRRYLMQPCFVPEGQKDPNLHGRVTLTFAIDPHGQVADPRVDFTTLNNSSVESCMVQTLLRVRFPRPVDGRPVLVTADWGFKNFPPGSTEVDLRNRPDQARGCHVLGETEVSGGLSRIEVLETAEDHRADAERCYDDELARSPGTSGKFTLAFTVEPDGHVSEATVGETTFDGDERLHDCVISAVLGWKFPASQDSTRVTHPWIFVAPGR